MNAIQEDVEYKIFDLKLLRKLLKLAKPYRNYLFIAVLLTIINSTLAPLRPYLLKIGIDEYIAIYDFNGLLQIIALIFLILVLNGILQYSLTFLLNWVAQKVLLDLRKRLFEHIIQLPVSFFDKNPVGRLVTRVTNDVDALNEMFSAGIVMIIADILLIFWIVGFMLYIDLKLALMTLSVVPFLVLITIIFKNKVRVQFRKIRAKVAQMNAFLNEFVNGIFTIKIFQQEAEQSRKFDKINLEHRNLMIKTIFYYAIFFPTIEMLSAIALGVILWKTAGDLISGSITVGVLIAFVQYSEMFFRPIRDLTDKYTTLQSSMASSERILGLLENNEIVKDKPNAIEFTELKDKIEFKNLSFSYDENKPVLKNVSFEVKKGTTTAIVGATGSGKTTLISLLLRFYDYKEGQILIDGVEIKNYSLESLRKRIALVMQDVFLFSRTISSNISLDSEEIKAEDILQASKELGCYEYIKRLNEGFETTLTEKGATLSSGQKQLISFCRAYIRKPNILVLDEATSNVDSETEKVIENALIRLLENRTTIVIAHRLSTIKRADNIIVLHHGSVKEIGTHKELLEKNGIYARLYKLQYEIDNQNGVQTKLTNGATKG